MLLGDDQLTILINVVNILKIKGFCLSMKKLMPNPNSASLFSNSFILLSRQMFLHFSQTNHNPSSYFIVIIS
uniref:Uncharacterized protein n=1 Tax=Lepeophtheirus salmonis TaxID=72036 RepID=A0A0K2UZ76_LEPSM